MDMQAMIIKNIGVILKAMQNGDTKLNESDLKSVTNDINLIAQKLSPAPNREIFEYIRERFHGQIRKCGIVVGYNDQGVIKIGWAKCNFSKGDTFNFNEGMKIARERAFATNSTPIAPQRNKEQIRNFITRCIRYFKDASMVKIAR